MNNHQCARASISYLSCSSSLSNCVKVEHCRLAPPQGILSCPEDHFLPPGGLTLTTLNWHWWAIHQGCCNATLQEMSARHQLAGLFPYNLTRSAVETFCDTVLTMSNSINHVASIYISCLFHHHRWLDTAPSLAPCSRVGRPGRLQPDLPAYILLLLGVLQGATKYNTCLRDTHSTPTW